MKLDYPRHTYNTKNGRIEYNSLINEWYYYRNDYIYLLANKIIYNPPKILKVLK